MVSETSGEPSRRVYEFGQLENQAFTRLAVAMQWVALLQIAIATLLAASAAEQLVSSISDGSFLAMVRSAALMLVPALIGLWTYRAGRHFRLIVRTQGDDIRHLMDAIGELTKLYILQLLLFLLAVGLLLSMIAFH